MSWRRALPARRARRIALAGTALFAGALAGGPLAAAGPAGGVLVEAVAAPMLGPMPAAMPKDLPPPTPMQAEPSAGILASAEPADATSTAARLGTDDLSPDGVTAGAEAVRIDPPHPAIAGVISRQFGTSASGRPLIVMNRRGSASPTRRVLAVAGIHGDELGGRAVIEALSARAVPADLDLWWVLDANPDGATLQRHGNAAGVDLNRNFATLDWTPPGGPLTSGTHRSGSAPASEPETHALMTLLADLRPDVTVWYHQPWATVDCDESRAGPACLAYADAVGYGVSFAARPGTATDWIMSNGLGASFVVELAPRAPSPATIDRHVAALLALG